MALNNIGAAGQEIRKVYQRRLPENPNKDYYYIIRETGNTEPLLVEYGFIDNEKDAKKLQSSIELYVEGVVKAIADYTNYPYTTPTITDNYYTVQRGDTLYSISRKFNTSVDELRRLNNLSSDILSIGQKILLRPIEQTPTVKTYTVRMGDTLYSIAQEFNTTVDKIKQLNNLTSNTLKIGQILSITSEDSEIKPEDNNPNTPTTTKIYTVKKGDSLWLISQLFNTTVAELIKLNNLSTINLQIGDKILVPSEEKDITNTYIVKKGDTLWSIAKEYNTSVNEIKSLNNLTNNLLSIGQQLILPN